MSTVGAWWDGLRRLATRWRPHRRHPRLIRRTHIRCPRTAEFVELEIELGETLADRRIVRCSAHPERPPPCDQHCRFAPETFLGPADALIILPEGCADTVEQD